MKTIEEIANLITARYDSEEHYFGDELEMVHAAVTAALQEDRKNIIQALEEEKVLYSDYERSDDRPLTRNGTLWQAQELIRKAD